MDKRTLQALFGGKLHMELDKFREEMEQKKPEEIVANEYQIDCKINLYELLITMSVELSEEELRLLFSFPDLLDYIYNRWLRTKEPSAEARRLFLVEEKADLWKGYVSGRMGGDL